jgi:hypothetical protein
VNTSHETNTHPVSIIWEVEIRLKYYFMCGESYKYANNTAFGVNIILLVILVARVHLLYASKKNEALLLQNE